MRSPCREASRISSRQQLQDPVFEPLRPASRRRLIVTSVIGPFLWLVGVIVVGVVVRRGQAVEIGVALALGAVVVATCMLLILRRLRLRQEAHAGTRG